MTPDSVGPDLRIAIVVLGRRGVSVLERLAVRAAEHPGRGVHVIAIDRIEAGTRRVWRTDRPDWLTINTAAGHVTICSVGCGGAPDRAGHGPSRAVRPDPRLAAVGSDGYAPRVSYGRHLRGMCRNLLEWLPVGISVESVAGHVMAVPHAQDGSFSLRAKTPASLWTKTPACTRIVRVGHIVLATGYPRLEPAWAERDLARYAARDLRLSFLAGDSAADMPLKRINRAEMVGTGLTCHDALLAPTVGSGRAARSASRQPRQPRQRVGRPAPASARG